MIKNSEVPIFDDGDDEEYEILKAESQDHDEDYDLKHDINEED